MQISNQEWLTFSICEVQIADVPFASKAPKSIRNSQAMKRDANEMFFSVYSGLSKLSKSSFVFTSFYEKKFAPVYPFGLPVNAIIWTSASRTDTSMLSCPASSKSGVPSLFFFPADKSINSSSPRFCVSFLAFNNTDLGFHIQPVRILMGFIPEMYHSLHLLLHPNLQQTIYADRWCSYSTVVV